MEKTKEQQDKEKKYEIGDIVFHTSLPGHENPLPKLPEGLKWRGYERNIGSGDFIRYIVVDKNAEPPSIDEFPPTDEPLFKTAQEAEEYQESKLAEKIEKDWEAARSEKGRPPIGGAQDD